jgi:hypothetical protein
VLDFRASAAPEQIAKEPHCAHPARNVFPRRGNPRTIARQTAATNLFITGRLVGHLASDSRSDRKIWLLKGYDRGTTDLYPPRQQNDENTRFYAPALSGLPPDPGPPPRHKHALSMLNVRGWRPPASRWVARKPSGWRPGVGRLRRSDETPLGYPRYEYRTCPDSPRFAAGYRTRPISSSRRFVSDNAGAGYQKLGPGPRQF